MSLIGIDIGSTHCKAGLFAADGRALRIASRPALTHHAPEGWAYIDPAELWAAVSELLQEAAYRSPDPVRAIGVASMAESGLLLDPRTGQPRSEMVPWFEPASQAQAEQIRLRSNPLECYIKYGLRPNFKNSLAKLLWLRQRDPRLLDGAVWLSAADYIAYQLCGQLGTDYSLACRSLAFRVDRCEWDAPWLESWGIDPGIFPPARPAGASLGDLPQTLAGSLGIQAGAVVAVCGHDHVCAAFGMGAVKPGSVFDSMGTAETLIGALPVRSLDEADFSTGLLYGRHVAEGQAYWLGGMSASGGSVEWARRLLNDPPLSYDELDSLLDKAPAGPSGILYFPYLLGSGSPHTDPQMRAGFAGLSASHGRADLIKAVLEGTAFELELIRRAGERMTGQAITGLVAAGGGTRSRGWMQIKADVTGCRIQAPDEPEATLLGAALAAGAGAGVYASQAQALTGIASRPSQAYTPDAGRHERYRRLFEAGFETFLKDLSDYGKYIG